MSISQKTLHKVIAICLRWSFLSHIHKVTVQEQELQLLVSKHCAASDKKVTFQLFPLESSVLVMRVMQQDAEQNARYDICRERIASSILGMLEWNIIVQTTHLKLFF